MCEDGTHPAIVTKDEKSARLFETIRELRSEQLLTLDWKIKVKDAKVAQD